MKTKTLKIIIDILMVVFLIMCIPSSRSGQVFLHVIQGTVFTLLVVIHVLLNRKWLVSVSKNLMSGKLKGNIKCQYGVDIFLMAIWGLTIITGFIAMGFSLWGVENLFGFIRLHGVLARVGGVLIIVHILQHSSQIASYIGLKSKKRNIQFEKG